MAKFRMVHTEFWNDPKVVEEMTPEDKFFFLYLLTNSNTTQVGIYQITKKQIAFDIGYSIESINSLLDRFVNHHKLVKYNPDTREVAIKNWGKYNLNRGGKPMLDCVRSELEEVKDKELIPYVGENVTNKNIKDLYDTWDDTSTIRPQYKEEEKEEEEYTVRDLFDHYLSKNIIKHNKITGPIRTAINARLRDYSYEQLIQVIDNYAEVYFSDNHWFSHKYSLADLMRDKDVRKFIDDADPLVNFANSTPNLGSKANKSKNKEDFDLS